MPDEEGKSFYPITAMKLVSMRRYINESNHSDIKSEKVFKDVNVANAKVKNNGVFKTIKLFTTGALNLGLTDYGIRLTAYFEASQTGSTYENMLGYTGAGEANPFGPIYRFGLILGEGEQALKWKPRVTPFYDALTQTSEGNAFVERWITPSIEFKYWGSINRTMANGEGRQTSTVIVNKLIFPLTIGVQTNSKLSNISPWNFRRDTFIYNSAGDLPYLPTPYSPKRYVYSSFTTGMTRNDTDISKSTAAGGVGASGTTGHTEPGDVFRKLLYITVDPSITDLTNPNRFITSSYLDLTGDTADTFTITNEEGWMANNNVIFNPTD